jgi:hexosaminidase
LDEVVPLFPGKYFHIGGDECMKTRWERCIKCQAKIKSEHLADEHELQSYFIKRTEKYLQGKGKKIIGWDEILEGGVSTTATIMSWRGTKGGVQAAKQGNEVIMTPSTYCYLNYYQGIEEEEPLAIKNDKFVPLQKVYTFDPTPDGFTAEQAKFILGGQGNVWTEYIATPLEAEYMVLPRALALSECLWSQPQNKNYLFFEQKVHAHYERMELYGINFSKSADRQSTIEKWNKEINR